MPLETYATLLNLKKVMPSARSNHVAVDRDYWIASIYPTLSRIDLDENWYIDKYQDVAEAIRRNTVLSARQHYCQSGYFENRLPYEIEVNESWYLSQYPDVQAAISKKIYISAQEHFEEIGFKEGRHPYPGFALRTLDDGAHADY